MTSRAEKLRRLGNAVLPQQSQAWNWLDMENGQERADDAIIKITDSAGRVICSATAGWLKAVSLYPPSDELPEEPTGDEQRSIASLQRRVLDLIDEKDAMLRRAETAEKDWQATERSLQKYDAQWDRIADALGIEDEDCEAEQIADRAIAALSAAKGSSTSLPEQAV